MKDLEVFLKEIKKTADIKKSNPNYSMLKKNGNKALQITVWNDDSGKPLSSVVIEQSVFMNLFYSFLTNQLK